MMNAGGGGRPEEADGARKTKKHMAMWGINQLEKISLIPVALKNDLQKVQEKRKYGE